MPHPAFPEVQRSVEAALAAGDADAALAAVRPLASEVAAEDGAAFRSLIARLPDAVWQHDAVVASAMGASFRAADSKRGSAAIGYFHAAEAGLAAEDRAADSDRMRVWLEATLAHHTGQSVEQVSRDIERDKILSAAAAAEYGIVDQVLESRKAHAAPTR